MPLAKDEQDADWPAKTTNHEESGKSLLWESIIDGPPLHSTRRICDPLSHFHESSISWVRVEWEPGWRSFGSFALEPSALGGELAQESRLRRGQQ